MKLIKARQDKESGKWGTPEEEKQKMEYNIMHAFEGTEFFGKK